jgi:hypothetical protein
MINRYALLFGLVVAISHMPACLAGPCSQEIGNMQARIDAKLQAAAAAGPAGQETIAATMNRQPTPKSIAAAEVKLGDISAQTLQTVEDAMARARKADASGDGVGCQHALNDVRKTIGD